MRRRLWICLAACLLCLAGAWWLWYQAVNPRTKSPALPPVATAPAPAASAVAKPSKILTPVYTRAAKPGPVSAGTNEFAFRLSNTARPLDQLMGDRHAVLLANAFIDTGSPLSFSIPSHLQSQGDPGAYIVQARGPVDAAFRAMLAAAGAQVVAYIPNDAYLVRIDQGGAEGLAANGLVQAVVSYEPYYKIQLPLLGLALQQKPLPEMPVLTLGLFPDAADQTIKQIERITPILARDTSPFGPIVRVVPPKNWTALATLPGVQILEPSRQRARANDISRVTTGVATDTVVSSNYLNLSGSNVLVNVNDTGIDANHPDFGTGGSPPSRVIGDTALALVDTNGHGTHVAGIIAGNGFESITVTNASGSILTNNGLGTAGQFRGKAPLAKLYSVAAINSSFNFLNFSDQYLQQAPAQTNALISNNSWNYGADNAYDLAAASYDAAVRDALPQKRGSQPVLFVFSAGNNGNGDDSGGSGDPNTIQSPATAKNVMTVGALEQSRNIANQVTNADGSVGTPWATKTDTSFQVSDYSSRGNVGIGTEGTFGRFKPDVVAPGNFVISTRSSEWDTNGYYHPTNDHVTAFADVVLPGSFTDPPLQFFVYKNAVQVTIQAFAIGTSTNIPLAIYVWPGTDPNTTPPILAGTNIVVLPPVPNNVNWQCAITNDSADALLYEFVVNVQTTNDLGNYFEVLQHMNDTLGPPGNWYRYESGTSMAAAEVSGVLALMQDYFTNTLQLTPSPALLKAMAINGARVTSSSYDLQVQNAINYEGWGLINLPDSLPSGVTTNLAAAGESMLILDQSPDTALATGNQHTYKVSVTNAAALSLPLRITLAWTDPPGDPAAAIKLVNDLNLVVTNMNNTNIYYGNNIQASSAFNSAVNASNAPVYDSINNVENVYLQTSAGTNYFVTVQGYRVNVNAVTAHTNDVVQDYALVISCGDGTVTNAFTVTDIGGLTNSTGSQQITYILSTNSPLLNQLVGASPQLPGTNTLPLGTNTIWGTNGVLTLGRTNQWHFYVITNTGAGPDFTNAAFVTFLAPTLSIPRMGVFAGTQNATRPEADIDLYVAGPNDPNASGLTNLNPLVISNCLVGANGDASSLGRGGTEFVTYTNSVSITANPGNPSIYYVGVYSEDQEASEYGFIPIFTDIPFSQPGPHGSQIVNGLPLPINVPDGSTAHPGVSYVFALALFPMQVSRVVVTNALFAQNFGDLLGTLTHSQSSGLASGVILNNHNSPSAAGTNLVVYDDSGQNNILFSQPTAGPGSLNGFVDQQGNGPWILSEVDDSPGQVGGVNGLTLLVEPNRDLTGGVGGTLGPLGSFFGFIDVPPGATNLSLFATNLTATGLVDMFVKLGSIPTLTDTNEFGPVGLTNGAPPGNSLSIGPPITPGRYWVALINESVVPQDFFIIATLGIGTAPQATFTSAGPVPLLDDAVTTQDQFVPVSGVISTMEVGLRVDHPRVSDLVFHLVSPQGTRVLLVENRGGADTHGMGATLAFTNIIPVSASGGDTPDTNIVHVAVPTGVLTITYDFFTVPDQMVVYDQNGVQLFNSGIINGSGVFNIGYTNTSSLTIVMNPNGGIAGTGWEYTVQALQGRFTYLVLTEDTNRTTTPIKFAPTPFAPAIPVVTNAPTWHSSFEGTEGNITPVTGTVFPEGWQVFTGDVDVLTNGTFGAAADEGNYFVDLNGNNQGTITTNVPTVPGQSYVLSFAYAQNPNSLTNVTPGVAAQLRVDGITLVSLSVTNTNSWAKLGWATTSVVFTAASSSTLVRFRSQTAGPFGLLLDCIDISAGQNDGFENAYVGDYAQGVNPGFGSWTVITNQVTVISNSVLAKTGTNLLALADGQISRILPTIPGQPYTVSFAYRGPGLAAFWRAESNTLDSVNGNNATASPGITYPAGQVGRGFNFDGSTSLITVPASPSLAVSSVTLEAWIFPTDGGTIRPIFDYGGAGQEAAISLWLNTETGLALNPGGLHGLIRGPTITSPALEVDTVNRPVLTNQWNHVAFTADLRTLTGILYFNGVPVRTNTAPSPVFPPSFESVNLGYRDSGSIEALAGVHYQGIMDEASIYARPLSASEILAIYNQGTNGIAKFSTNAPSVADGLAEAQVTLNGTAQPIFFANNTNWQTATYSFIATTNNTPLQITGLEPGMLLDDVAVVQANTNNFNLYFLPEQSLDTLSGENALGSWQLEVLDNRVGATNNPEPSLLSWQMHFIFTEPVATLAVLTNGVPQTNNVPPGGIVQYMVLVPTNADISTNILFNTTGPLNLIFDQTVPPTGFNPPDFQILTSFPPSTYPPGSWATNNLFTFPTNFVAGGTYFLGVQNPALAGSPDVNFSIVVNFHLVPPPLVLPQLPELIAYADQLFVVTNRATNGTPPYTYGLTTTVPGLNVPIIDPATGGITWTPDTNQAPSVYTFTNVVTDSGTPAQFATNIFHLLVVLTNGLPAFPGAEGAGGFAIGGRGGDVYHVINVNDSGPGSLRYGIQTTFGSRTIVFDVSGAINLFSNLKLNKPYFTIAGQTAPGDGIALQGLLTSVEDTHDEHVRFFRCRPGDIYAPFFQDDSFHFRGVTNSIADHVSASWSIDEVLSTTLSTNVTVQWSMIAEPLNHSAHLMDNGSPGFQAHGYGSLIRYGSGEVSYHHNLYADNYSRNPRPGDSIQLDFINNVVFNWGIFAGYNEDDSKDNPGGYTNLLNYSGNFLIVGSNTTANPNIAFQANVPDPLFTQIFQATNFIDTNFLSVVLNGTNTGAAMFSGNFTTLLAPPISMTNGIPVSTNAPALAYEQVLDFAGASVAGSSSSGIFLLRDPVDTNIVAGVRNKTGQIIDFISSNNFAGVYLNTNFGVTWSGYDGAATYWASQGLTNFVGANPWPQLNPAPQPLDSDGDGIPDYWEITLTAIGETNSNPLVPSNNHNNPDGYTDLEHYINWLASPHALTVSNVQVAVDLHAIAGRTGNLVFSVGNPTNGLVTLTNSIATFAPSNTFFGFGSFDFTVTNLATTNGFGPVRVSVMVSVTNILTSSTLLTNGVPQTNSMTTNGITYFLINVPPNAQIATNILLFADAPVNLLFSQAGFPTGTNLGDFFLLQGSLGGQTLLTSNSIPTNIVAGGSYYLGVQNTNGVPVNFAVEVDFFPPPPVPVAPVVITSVTHTNLGTTNGFLIQWFAPTNDLFRIQWATNLTPTVKWNLFTNLIRYTGPLTATNGLFSFFDDGTQTGGLGLQRFYRLLLVQSANLLSLPVQTNQNVSPTSTLVVTNTATDSDTNATLNYTLTGPAGAVIDTNGIITWTPSVSDANTVNLFTTIVADNGVPPAHATNSFIVSVGAPSPKISGFTLATNGFFQIQWSAPTNYQFQVEWTTNLASPAAWNYIPTNPPWITTTNVMFTFVDTNAPTHAKFYRLIQKFP